MAEPRNFANAIVIVAGIYFLIEAELGFWAKIGIIILMLFAFLTWGHWSNPFQEEEKKLLNAKIKSEEARALNFNMGSRQLAVQTKLLARGLPNGQ